MLSLWDDYVFAAGFLPVADAALDVRRARCSNEALEISAGSGKLYFRVLDKGAYTAAAGEHYSAVAYRHILARPEERTAFYAVRMPSGAAYLYADWHDFAGLDRLPVPADLIGRSFEIVDSHNAGLSPGVLAGSLPVSVNAGSSYGYIVLKLSG